MKKTLQLSFLFITVMVSLSNHLLAQTWQELGTGTNALNPNGGIYSVIADKQGNVYAAGTFYDTSTQKYYVAKWNGTTWSELGTGINALNANDQIFTLAQDKFGNIYAAGKFTDSAISTKGHRYVAKWDGNSWSELGTGIHALNANNFINSVSTDSTGNVYAAGRFTNSPIWSMNGTHYVAKWNGTDWVDLDGLIDSLHKMGQIGEIQSLVTDKNGYLYAGGNLFDTVYQKYFVARFTGTNWSYMGGHTPTCIRFLNIATLAVDTSNKAIYEAGYDNYSQNNKNFLSKLYQGSCSFLGSGTSSLINDYVLTSAVDINDNYYVAGNFTDSTPNLGYRFVAKWDGTNWSELGTGANALMANNAINSITTDAQGNVYAAGNFTNGNGKPYVAKYTQPAAGINNLTNNAAKNDLKVYPNPTTNQLTVSGIQFSGNTKLEVENILGQVMVSLSNHLTTANCQLTTANLPSGIYILKATDEKGFVHTAKFVKE